ncbi:cytochrome P450 [Actinophytocola oryzae]|uniref:cytochrome P450 n=1 Tax=Actinophytocola oryzae TaxID=502181 RepID=UPI001AAF16A6|nr:cytochrome P450 [Actinophytocola oryzae]
MSGNRSARDEPAGRLLRHLLGDEGRRDPYPVYRRLHDLGPVAALPDGNRYAAVVHGHDAVGQALRDDNLRVLDAAYLDRAGTRWREHPAVRTLQSSLFHASGAKLAYVRRLFGQAFGPTRVTALEPMLDRITGALLDRLAALGANGTPVDFMAEFALRLPSDVIGELFGVPASDRSWFPSRVAAFDAVIEVGQRPFREVRAADAAAEELTAYFADLLATRRADPGDDLVSALATTDTGLTEVELLASLVIVFNAGFRTTTNLLGNGLRLLVDHPELLAALREDHALAPAYVEEILRLEPAVHVATRYAVETTDIAGVSIPEGRPVVILTGAANRDPRRFPDPDRFDPTRADNHHYSFSAGPHFCIGAALGRAETGLALPRLLSRFPSLALASPPGPRRHLVLRGYDRLELLLRKGLPG